MGDGELFSSFYIQIHLFRQREQIVSLQLRVLNPVNMVLNVDQQVENPINIILKMQKQVEDWMNTHFGEIVFSSLPSL